MRGARGAEPGTDAAGVHDDVPQQGLAFWMPRCCQAFFTAATLWLLFAEFTPALQEYVRARESERVQLLQLDAAYDELEHEERRLRSLLHDPQSIERALDEKGLLPPGHPARRRWTELPK